MDAVRDPSMALDPVDQFLFAVLSERQAAARPYRAKAYPQLVAEQATERQPSVEPEAFPRRCCRTRLRRFCFDLPPGLLGAMPT